MVGVEPVALGRGEAEKVGRREVVGAEREGLEVEVSSGGIGSGLTGEHHVLDADAEMPGDIDPRLIGDDIARAERHEGTAALLLAYLMRAFVHAEVVADAVSRAVAVVVALLPERDARRHVDLQARRAEGETQHLHADVGAQDGGIGASLLRRDRAEGDGAGDVGRAATVVRTAIDEQQATRLQGQVGGGCRLVVHDGGVVGIRADGGEGEADKVGLLLTQAEEDIAHREFAVARRGVAAHDLALQPREPAHHRHAVLTHRLAESVLLHGVFDRLPRRERAADEGGLGITLREAQRQRSGHVRHAIYGLLDVGVGTHADALGREIGRHLGGKVPGVGVEGGRRGADGDEGVEIGVVVDVAAAQVGEPRHFGEFAREEGVAAALGEPLAQTAEFVGDGLSCDGLGHDADRAAGQGGAVAPYLGEGVGGSDVAHAALLGQVGGGGDSGVVAHGGDAFGGEPCVDGGRIGLTIAHQADVVGEFVGGLEEVARVGPQRSTAHGHDGGAGTAGEGGEPLPRLVVRREIFGGMRVCGRHDEGLYRVLLHPCAQQGKGRCHSRGDALILRANIRIYRQIRDTVPPLFSV